MKYPDNIEQVASLQPDYLGFIFYEKSQRYFVENNIPELPNTIKKVGVFVDEDLGVVIENIKKYNLQAVQLHGNESPEYCENLKRFCHSALNAESITNKTNIKQIPAEFILSDRRKTGMTEIIKAFSMDESFNFDDLKPYETVCDYFLFDTKGKLPGGNGFTFDWSVLKNYTLTKPFFLSGGIGLNETENLLSLLKKTESRYCYAIDVNSKFEIEPGLKNIELLKEFKKNVITRNPDSSR